METLTSESLESSTAATLSLEKPIDDYIEYRLAKNIRQFGTLMICGLGILGNVLSIFVLFQKQNRKISCYLYFGAIAIADIMLLLSALWYQTLVYHYSQQITDIVCRFGNAQWFAASTASAYLLLFATLDR